MARTSSASSRVGTPGSRADVVTASLRADILAGRLAPGRRLTFPDLCANYGVSVGVMREALVRLVDRGIVRTESNLGFSVMTLAAQDLAGLAAVRAHIESMFVRDSVLHGSVHWEAAVISAHHLLERAPMVEGGALSDRWTSLHADFHLTLVAGAENRRMMEMVSRLRDESDLYRRWYFDDQQAERHGEQVAQEHRALTDAVLSRDVDRAEELSRRHIEDAANLWIDGRAVNGAEPA